MKTFFKSITTLLSFILALTACGGGGGGGGGASIPAAPSHVTAAAGDGQVTIRWDAVSGADSYNIYWKTAAGVTTSDAKISGVTSPYVHSPLTNGQAYYYRVSAANGAGESGLSAEVSATPVAAQAGSGSLLWNVTANPSTTHDKAYGMAIDSTSMYVVGSDYSLGGGGQAQWRIEKRNLSDGALVSGFGTAGVIASNPTGAWDEAYAIAIDTAYMYVAGYDGFYAGGRWRIEKRALLDGALASSVTSTGNIAYGIAIDSSNMYVVGYDSATDNRRWRIEKRILTDMSLVTSFDSDGVVYSNVGGLDDIAYGIAIDASSMYVVGTQGFPAVWRIEKRNLTDGALVSSVTTTGARPYSIAIDSTYLYVGGDEFVDQFSSDVRWRIEKRRLSDLSLAAGFGSGGIVTSDPSIGWDDAWAIAIDSQYLYVSGKDHAPGGYKWRIEKRSLTDGSLVTSFDGDGVVTSTPGGAEHEPRAVAVDGGSLYAAGYEETSPGSGDFEWRIEKRVK